MPHTLSDTLRYGGLAALIALGAGEPTVWAAQPPGDCVERVQSLEVRGDSMVGVLEAGQTVEARYGYYGCHAVVRGDLVVVELPGREAPIIKQALVLPGDRFELASVDTETFRLMINGEPLRQPDGAAQTLNTRQAAMLRLYYDSFAGVMPSGMCFVFGTGLQGSADSTKFGPVPLEQLAAKVEVQR